MNQRNIINKAEEVADEVLRYSKHLLPHVAHFCLVSTFIEDGIRMWLQWNEQRDYMNQQWRCGWFISSLFVVFNLLAQLGGSVLVLTRKYVKIGCGVLFSVVVLQTLAYSFLWEMRYLFRNLSLAGAVVLLLAESIVESRSLFPGLPAAGSDNAAKQYMQLGGRLLIVLMFVNVLQFGFSPVQLLQTAVAVVLMCSVAVGYKTKLSALVLVLWLTVFNLYYNCWWQYEQGEYYRDYLKYDFFITASVIGGLMLIVALGPGGVSLDEHKKKW